MTSIYINVRTDHTQKEYEFSTTLHHCASLLHSAHSFFVFPSDFVCPQMIVGANNHTEEGEDDGKNAATICTRDQENHIEGVLGTERRNRLISTVYLMRCDVVPAVADLAFRVRRTHDDPPQTHCCRCTRGPLWYDDRLQFCF
jgi:hypothetical protein